MAAAECESGDTLWERGVGAANGGAAGIGGQSTSAWSSTGLEIKVTCALCLSCRYQTG